MICGYILGLFPGFPKDVNIVFSQRKARVVRVGNVVEMEKLVYRYSGVANIFIWLYERNVIDKVFFDIDAPRLGLAFEEARILAEYLREKNYAYIPVFSGKKGFHFYVLSKPLEFREGELVSEDTAKAILGLVQQKIVRELGLRYVDKRLMGTIRHWVRLPNTKRPDSPYYCTFLPQNFYELSLGEVIEMARYPQCPYYVFGELLDLGEYFFNYIDDFQPHVRGYDVSSMKPAPGRFFDVYPESGEDVVALVKDIVRPCILREVLKGIFTGREEEVDHWARTYFVSELLWAGFSQESVERIISFLRWEDYNPRITHYHVSKIYEKRLFPPSCRKLREQGFCLGERCPYYPFYNFWWFE